VSAVALIPLTLWFVLSLWTLPALDYATVRAWLSFPLSAFGGAVGRRVGVSLVLEPPKVIEDT